MPDLQPTVEDEDEDVNWGPPSQDPQPHFAGAPQPTPQTYLNPRMDKVDASSSSSSRNPQRRAAPANRFASLSDFNNNEDDDDDEGRQNLFAGGEKSSPSHSVLALTCLQWPLNPKPQQPTLLRPRRSPQHPPYSNVQRRRPPSTPRPPPPPKPPFLP